jgi:hypothetical protein
MKAFPGNRFEGMELRDYFAAKAMEAWINQLGKPNWDETIAQRAYKMADAMMEERGQPEAWVKTYSGGKPNYTEPKEWVGLTDEELEFYTEELGQGELGRGVLRAVVDFLKEKNT